MKEKYAEQDEEERHLRMQLIGAKDVKGIQWKNKDDEKFEKKSKDKKKNQLDVEDDS